MGEGGERCQTYEDRGGAGGWGGAVSRGWDTGGFMPVEMAIIRKPSVRSPAVHAQVEGIADRLLGFMQTPAIEAEIAGVHKFGASSHDVQRVVLPVLTTLGFVSEKRGLFVEYGVSGLRPDYYLPVADTGILLEVERGKTTTNNMDLLDLWKCHICRHAEYLFLLVPHERPSENGQVLRHFRQVQPRLATFFEAGNHVNVEAVFLFGY